LPAWRRLATGFYRSILGVNRMIAVCGAALIGASLVAFHAGRKQNAASSRGRRDRCSRSLGGRINLTGGPHRATRRAGVPRAEPVR
jgi:hypothetical protein